MYHKFTQRATDFCLNHKWISYKQSLWCTYVIEKKINTLSMKVFLILIAVLAGKSLEIFAFSMSVTALRQRLGGWHAKNAWSCQIVSVFSALFAVFVIGPHMEKLAIWIIILFDIIIFLFGLVLKPVYPPQLHFLDDVIEANNQKKRQVLYIILIAQILSLIF